jgi:Bacterial Ig-like domain
MRRIMVLVTAALVMAALIVVMAGPAMAQESAPPCNTNFCLDQTADPSTVTAGEPITFTIAERCPMATLCNISLPLVDTLPSGLSIVSVADSQPNYQCSTSGNTVTCLGDRFSTPTQPFSLTIVATPMVCGSFTNTASNDKVPSIGFYTVEAAFTVEGCDIRPPEVVAVTPDGTNVVPRASTVTANFSEAVQAATLTSNTVQLFSGNSTKPIKATLSWNPSNKPTSVTLTPSSKLDAKTRYTAKITGGATGVKDLAGNPLSSNFSWSFTTGSM